MKFLTSHQNAMTPIAILLIAHQNAFMMSPTFDLFLLKLICIEGVSTEAITTKNRVTTTYFDCDGSTLAY
jgi:hypothetical protein